MENRQDFVTRLPNPQYQSFDGRGNNLQYPQFGAADTPLLDIAPLDYSNGFSTPAGQNRPNPRVISNAISQQIGDILDPRGLTDFIWAWGQFLDHDLSFTPELSRQEASAQGRFINIPVPAGDPFLDPLGTGNVVIEVRDSEFIEGTGTNANNPRQLPNVITSWIDGSNVYGSSRERANFLRAFEGGRLRTSSGNLLPLNQVDAAGNPLVENDNPTQQDQREQYVAGDVRANENAVLTSIHTLFVREHNRLAERLAELNPYWTDEQLYQRARQLNIAQIQSITFNEYLPALLGSSLPEYTGYDSHIDPAISRAFSNAAFRLGHTQLSSEILRLDTHGQTISQGNLTLSEVFFPRPTVVQEAGIEPILRGIASSPSQRVDNEIIDDVRNLLFGFGPTGTVSARDLAAINIQRGRANGLADYNSIREAFGLPRVTSFAEITSDPEKQATLRSLYGNVNNIDFFVGMLAEDHLPGASVGESIAAVLTEQFLALRDGDRFYYENVFTSTEIALIEDTRLSEIIRHNTDTTIIQDNVFSLVNEGTSGNETLNGGLGNDTINGQQGNDHLFGYAGDDRLNGGRGRDVLNGGSGNDTLLFSADGIWNNDFQAINGGSPGIPGTAETILLGGYNRSFDQFIGGSGIDTIVGTSGNDALFLDDSFSDIPSSGNSQARIAGVEVFQLGDGNDIINLTSEHTNYSIDTILAGGNGNDVLWASSGNDELFGGRGDDRLDGGAGNDRLDGYDITGTEYDTLTGGAGFDTFVLGGFWGVSYQGLGYATITDWDFERDHIEVIGNSSQYSLGYENRSGDFQLDTLIRQGNDLIAVVEDTTNVIFSRDFLFV
ncbi:MAG: peroxidase family protein [Coleofasciculaceae cyanobacterium]